MPPSLARLARLPEVVANGGKVPSSYVNPSWISLRYDLGIPDDATITGVGSVNFSNSGYGTLNLPAQPGGRGAETVTQRIQSALDRAANGPVGIVWDVRCSLGVSNPSGPGNTATSALWLRRPGNLHVVGRPGSGAILRAQSNSAMISNELPTFGTAVSGSGTNTQVNALGGIQFGNVLIENLYLNANTGTSSGSPTAMVPGPNQPNPWLGSNQTYCNNIFRMFGVQDVTFRNCSLVGCGGFHTWWGNWQRVRILGCTIDSQGVGGQVAGNDALHFNGPGDDLLVRDCLIACEDDYVALNCADGNNQGGLANIPAWGSITRARVQDCRSLGANWNGNFTRVGAAGNCVNTGHVFEGLSGPIHGIALVGNSQVGGAGTGIIDNIEFRDLNLDSERGMIVGPFVGNIYSYQNACTLNRLNISQVRRSGSNLAAPLVLINQTVGRLDLDDLRALDDGTSGSGKAVVRVASGSIGRFSARQVRLDTTGASATMPLLQVDSGASVASARLENVSTDHVVAVVANAGTLGTTMATGVQMTNAGSGAIVANSGTWSTSVLSNADPATADYTGTAPASKSGDYYGSGSGSLAAGSITVGTVTSSSVALSATDARGGSLPYTYQWYRSTSSGTLGSAISGATSRTLADSSVSASTNYYYTIKYTDAASATVSATQAAAATPSAGPTPYFDEAFVGTAGTSLVGRTPAPNQNGSDVWATMAGYGDLVIRSGGTGAVGTGSPSGNLWASRYPMTGRNGDGTYTFNFTANGGTDQVFFTLLADSSLQNLVNCYFNFASGVAAIGTLISGSYNPTAYSANVTLTPGTPYTAVYTIAGTSLSLALNGSTVFSGVTIPAHTTGGIVLQQQQGTTGDVIFSRATYAPTVYMRDTFTGTAGNTLTGHAASPTPNGSDVWQDYLSGNGQGNFIYVAGGGAKAASFGTGGAGSEKYPLTGLPQACTYSATFATSDTSADLLLIARLATDASSYLLVSFNFALNHLTLQSFAGGSTTTIREDTVTPNIGTANTIVFSLTATTITTRFNGTQIYSGVTVPSSTSTGFQMSQTLGTPGSVVFSEIKVTSN